MTQTHLQLELTGDGELLLHTATGPQRVKAARSFPWTAPGRFIVLGSSIRRQPTGVCSNVGTETLSPTWPLRLFIVPSE